MTDITWTGGNGRFGAAAPGAPPAWPPLDPGPGAQDAPSVRRLFTWRRVLALSPAAAGSITSLVTRTALPQLAGYAAQSQVALVRTAASAGGAS